MRYQLCVLWLMCAPVVTFAQTKKTGQAPPENVAVNKAMQAFVDSGEIAGAVTLVGHGGEIVHLGAVGWSDIESDRKMKKNNLFAIASMTKPIVATALMILQDEGKHRPTTKLLCCPAADVMRFDGVHAQWIVHAVPFDSTQRQKRHVRPLSRDCHLRGSHFFDTELLVVQGGLSPWKVIQPVAWRSVCVTHTWVHHELAISIHSIKATR